MLRWSGYSDDLRPIARFIFLMVSGSIGANVLRADPIPILEFNNNGLAEVYIFNNN
jgi:hypothetical protein